MTNYELAFVPSTAALQPIYDKWLVDNAMPSLCAHELSFEVAARIGGSESKLIDPETVCTPEQYDWLIHFCHRWWELQDEEDKASRVKLVPGELVVA